MNETIKAKELKKLLAMAGLPELGPGPRAGIMPAGELNQELNGLFNDRKLSPGSQQLIRGLMLLWHDQMDPAHEIAQAIENADGSFVHGILHRREPDYGNAGYWFRRVGRHTCFPELARRVEQLLKSKHELDLANRLIPNGEWDPIAFIAICEKADGRAADEGKVKLLREIQGIETEVLLEKWYGGPLG